MEIAVSKRNVGGMISSCINMDMILIDKIEEDI
jgi:hypothetical protein